MRKNVASQVVSAQLVSSSDGSDVTSGTTTVYVCGDGGTQASGGTATHEGNGTWSFLPSQANTNYDQVTFTFVNTSAVSAMVQLYPVAYDPTDAADLGVTALTGHTPQTGDSYAIVNSGTYGNAQLVRSTTPANTLDVSATGEAGVDWANVGSPTTSVGLSGTTVGTVTTLTGHTVQTGDSYAVVTNGTYGLSALDTDLGNIETDTQDIQGRLPATLTTGTADSGSTTTMVDAALTEADTDYWAGCWIRFTSGTITGQVRLITAFTPASDQITFAPATTQAVSTNTYEILPAAAVGIDWGAVQRPTTAVDLSATDIQLADTVTTLTGHTAQTGDSFARIGAPTGASISADIVALQSDTDDIQTRLPAALVSGRMDSDVGAMQSGVVTAAAIATDAITSDEFAASAAQKIRDEILPTQNAAFNNIQFLFVAASDHVTPVTGAGTMAVTRSIDGGAFGSGTGTGPAEIGNGIYQYDASAADMNGGVITFRFTATSGTPGAPDDTFVTIVTGGGV